MRVFRVRELSNEQRAEAVRELLLGRRVISCGVAEFAPGVRAHEGEEHVHEQDEVFVILCGEVTVPIKGGPSEVARAGDWVLVEAGEEHHLTNHTRLPCVAIYLIVAK